MRYFTTVKEFKVDQFDVIVDWTYEDCSVRDCFDETEEEFQEMERRLDAYLDTHYIARVRAMYDGVEMGSLLGLLLCSRLLTRRRHQRRHWWLLRRYGRPSC